MALNHYLVGSTVVMLGTCDVVDPITQDKTPTSPSTVTFTRQQTAAGTGVVTTTTYTLASPEVVVLSPGIASCTVTTNIVGREIWSYVGTGVCAAVAEDAFNVQPSSL